MSDNNIYIYGYGGMATLFHHIAKKNGLSIAGFCIEDTFFNPQTIENLPLKRYSEIVAENKQQAIDLYIAVGPTKMNHVREKIYKMAKGDGINTPNFICQSTFELPPYSIGDGNIILNSGVIHSGATIGDNNFLSSSVTLGHGVTLGNGNFFAGGVIVAGEATIQERCFFGLGVTISDNITIADESFIGQGCAITKNTEQGSTYTPAAYKKQKFKSDRFCDLVF
ncbi:hypothetical protein A9Q99_08355 [Gammaproteobacteria bacterium 45_16_T64]|nr:hypothetical protein A9Q99_08355 [Gammaproteobacteria bacterium 45_16_T64]